jgi:hypothetical protein
MVESLKAIKYIDCDSFAVPRGRGAVELLAGRESAMHRASDPHRAGAAVRAALQRVGDRLFYFLALFFERFSQIHTW